MGQRLYKRKDSPNWWIDFGKIHGERAQESSGCRDKRAAEAWGVKRERELRDPTHATANATTLSAAIKRAIEARKTAGRAKGTLSMHQAKAGHLCRILGADTPVAQIDAAKVDDYTAQRLEEGAARSTIGKELTTLRITLKNAKRRGEFPRDLDEVLPEEWSIGYKPRERFLDYAEAQAILDDLRNDDVAQRRWPMRHRAAHIAFILATSANWVESVRASRADIDLVRDEVKIHGSKTKYRERTVPIVSFMRPLLELVVYEVERKDPEGETNPRQRNQLKKTGRMFPPWGSVRGDMIRVHKRIAERVREQATKAREAGRKAEAAALEERAQKWEKPSTPNDWRRTCGTWLRMLGVEPHLIAAVLGHSDSRMVERVYGRLPPDALGEALRLRIDGKEVPLLGPPGGKGDDR